MVGELADRLEGGVKVGMGDERSTDPASAAELARSEFLRRAAYWAADRSTRQQVVLSACEVLFYFDSDSLVELAGLTGSEMVESEAGFSKIVSDSLQALDLPDFTSREARSIVVGETAEALKDTEFEQAVAALTRHSEVLAEADNEFLLEDGHEMPIFRMATLGRLVTSLEDQVLSSLMDDVERILVEGSPDVGEAVRTGFLEAVTGAIEHTRTKSEKQLVVRRLRRFVGPESLGFLRAWDRFHGITLW